MLHRFVPLDGLIISKQFHLPRDSGTRVSHISLLQTTQAMLEKAGVVSDDAHIAADVLVWANLRGVDSHGVSDMLPSHLDELKSGVINPQPDLRILSASPTKANLDSDRGLGVVAAPKSMENAIKKAQNVGVGMVTVCNGRHLGMAAYHAMMALEHDMIGVCITTVAPRIVPTFGAIPRLGTNPIVVAAPITRCSRDYPLGLLGIPPIYRSLRLILALPEGATIAKVRCPISAS